MWMHQEGSSDRTSAVLFERFSLSVAIIRVHTQKHLRMGLTHKKECAKAAGAEEG